MGERMLFPQLNREWYDVVFFDFCHVTCETKRDSKKTNDVVILSGLTLTTHAEVVAALVVICRSR